MKEGSRRNETEQKIVAERTREIVLTEKKPREARCRTVSEVVPPHRAVRAATIKSGRFCCTGTTSPKPPKTAASGVGSRPVEPPDCGESG